MEEIKNKFLASLVAYAVQRNIDAAQLCRLSGIDMDILEGRKKGGIAPSAQQRLWSNAMQLTGDKYFGLHFGESLQLAALGIVGQLIQTSATIAEAVQQAASFAHLVNDSVGIQIEKGDKEFVIHFIPVNDAMPKEILFQVIHFFMVFTLHELDGLLLAKLQPVYITLPQVTELTSEYYRIFRCQNLKKGACHAIHFPAKYWSQSIITADYELQQLLLKKLSTLQAKTEQAHSLQTKVYNHLLHNAYLGIPTIEGMAANLNISSRTLQRKLQEEGTSYQFIADVVRKSLALYYVESGNHALKEIAYLLGYNELSAFTRAFKRWTGTPPAAYQAS